MTGTDFLGLSVSTGLFYWIFEVEDTGRRVVWWRFFPEMITTFVCFIGRLPFVSPQSRIRKAETSMLRRLFGIGADTISFALQDVSSW